MRRAIMTSAILGALGCNVPSSTPSAPDGAADAAVPADAGLSDAETNDNAVDAASEQAADAPDGASKCVFGQSTYGSCKL